MIIDLSDTRLEVIGFGSVPASMEESQEMARELISLRAQLAELLGREPESIARDALRYRFLRDKDAFGDDDEPGLVSWDVLTDLEGNAFDVAIDARMLHPNIAYRTAMLHPVLKDGDA